ncbi:MAG TPA: hypothetical protein VHF25_04150 [Nitriliruptorales bacterium]|nr:hypothetical protein [Nitriliruptorales bacterium]
MSEARAIAPTAAAHGGPPAPRGRRPAAPAWVVAIVTAAVATVLFVWWYQADRARATDAQVTRVAGQVIDALVNWEADDLGRVRATVDQLGTDRFRDEARELLDDLAGGLARADATSRGELLDLVGTARAGDRRPYGVALAVVRQEVTNSSLDAPDVQCWAARAVLRHLQDRWLVDRLEVYGDNQCPQDS